MKPHDEIDENEYTAVIAVCSSLLSLPAIYAATRPIFWVHRPSWTPCLLASMFIIMPMVVAFIILYFGHWHPEWQKPKRLLWAILSSCLIFVADTLLAVCLAIIGICELQFVIGF